MHHERDPYTSYRIEVGWPAGSDKLIFSITTYPPDKAPIAGKQYREDALPEWVRVGVDMLDMAAVDGQALIPFFGTKTGSVYWFHAQQVWIDKGVT